MALRRLARSVAAGLIAIVAWMGVDAPVRASSSAPLDIVVPFGEPGDTDPLSRDATTDRTNDLSERRIRSAVSTPIDTQYRGYGVIVGRFKFEQSKERNLTGFIPLMHRRYAHASSSS